MEYYGRNCLRTLGWDGNNLADSGTGNSRGENKAPYGGMVDGGNINQTRDGSGTRGRDRKTTWFPVPVSYRSCPELNARNPELGVSL